MSLYKIMWPQVTDLFASREGRKEDFHQKQESQGIVSHAEITLVHRVTLKMTVIFPY